METGLGGRWVCREMGRGGRGVVADGERRMKQIYIAKGRDGGREGGEERGWEKRGVEWPTCGPCKIFLAAHALTCSFSPP